jgi:predicted TIM-barrel fold metal-dependent hydrolase
MIAACLPPREVTRPRTPLPPNACDTHAHVFGPADRFPYAADRSYTPPDARPFHEALVRANPERLVWGGDWPHPRVEGEMPDAGHLLELFQTWTPDQATLHSILVTNPAKLYGFPN